jgi:hypothetical protein
VYWRVGHYNSPGRWLSAIKKHYGVISLSPTLLQKAFKDHKDVVGLGPRFKKTAQDYIKSRRFEQ